MARYRPQIDVDQNPAPPLFAAVVGGVVFGGAVVGGAVVGGSVVAGATVVADPAAGADVVGAVVGELLVPTVFELEPHAAKPTLMIARQIIGAMRRRNPVPTAGPIRITSLTFLVHREVRGMYDGDRPGDFSRTQYFGKPTEFC